MMKCLPIDKFKSIVSQKKRVKEAIDKHLQPNIISSRQMGKSILQTIITKKYSEIVKELNLEDKE